MLSDDLQSLDLYAMSLPYPGYRECGLEGGFSPLIRPFQPDEYEHADTCRREIGKYAGVSADAAYGRVLMSHGKPEEKSKSLTPFLSVALGSLSLPFRCLLQARAGMETLHALKERRHQSTVLDSQLAPSV